MNKTTEYFVPSVKNVGESLKKLRGIVRKSPLEEQQRLSEKYEAHVWLKREDLQQVRSYKIRGAYNKISSLSKESVQNGIVCASAGNHAQGVALSCYTLGIKGTIFMPTTTPQQKVRKVKSFGKHLITVVLHGDSFDDAYQASKDFAKEHHAPIIPPFDDEKIIEGQATVGLEILHQFPTNIDYIFLPVGGGGLSAGVCSVFQQLSPYTKIIGIEPKGAPALKKSLEVGKVIRLDEIDTFADGAAVKRVGDLNFAILKEHMDEIALVPEGKICETMLELYDEDAIVVEPAGALSIAVLDQFAEEIKGKNVVCVVSGGNNDISRTEDIRERALIHKGLKHYFVVNFPQRAGALRDFVQDVLGPNDDIVFFQYQKKNSRNMGPALVGIELKYQKDLEDLIGRMKEKNFFGEYLNEKPSLFNLLL